MVSQPYRLNKVTRDKFLAALRKGSSIRAAAQSVRLHKSTVHEWLRCGRLEDGPKALQEFALDVDQAIAAGEVVLSGHIYKAAGKGQWQAAAWILERKNPEEWAKRDPELERSEQSRIEEMRRLHRVMKEGAYFEGVVRVNQSLEMTGDSQDGSSSQEPSP